MIEGSVDIHEIQAEDNLTVSELEALIHKFNPTPSESYFLSSADLNFIQGLMEKVKNNATEQARIANTNPIQNNIMHPYSFSEYEQGILSKIDIHAEYRMNHGGEKRYSIGEDMLSESELRAKLEEYTFNLYANRSCISQFRSHMDGLDSDNELSSAQLYDIERMQNKIDETQRHVEVDKWIYFDISEDPMVKKCANQIINYALSKGRGKNQNAILQADFMVFLDMYEKHTGTVDDVVNHLKKAGNVKASQKKEFETAKYLLTKYLDAINPLFHDIKRLMYAIPKEGDSNSLHESTSLVNDLVLT